MQVDSRSYAWLIDYGEVETRGHVMKVHSSIVLHYTAV